MPSLARLKERLALTLEAGRIDAALSAVAAISEIEPKDPVWPKRAARLCRAADDVPGQLAALRRALELQVGQGLVLEAITSCRSILEIVPEDEETLDCLDLLYLNGSKQLNPKEPRQEALPMSDAVRLDAPLDSLLLSEVVPGAHSIKLGDSNSEGISEIPIDDPGSSASRKVVDLRLEDWSSQKGADPAASQPVSKQKTARPKRNPSVLPPAKVRRPSAASAPAPADRGPSLRHQLATVPLFGELDPASLQLLIQKVRVVQLGPGEVLFREGEAANSLYVVVEGGVVPIAEGETRRKLAVLERGAFFGEIGLMTKQPRNATIEALVDTKLLAIDRRVLWELIENEESVPRILVRFLRARLIDRLIRTHAFFAAFALAERETVAREFRMLEVRDGARIVSAGRPPKGLFVLLSGHLELRDARNGAFESELGPGDVLGASSLLRGEPATRTAISRGKSWIVLLDEERFRRILLANARLESVLVELDGSAGVG